MNLRQIYTASCRLVNLVASNEEPTDENIRVAEQCLELLMATWSLNPRLQWGRELVSLTTDGTSNFVTLPVRPVAIHQAQWHYTAGNVNFPLVQITETEYYSISFRNITAPPSKFYWDHNLKVVIFPTPSAGTLDLLVQNPLVVNVSDLDTELALPGGYELAMKYSLAALLCDEYGRSDAASMWTKADALVELIQVPAYRPEVLRSTLGNTFGDRRGAGYVPLINK